ncbi:phosphatase PAP2 family protein [Ideonella sp. BN130291]|uniref:phosphatase PAP2 family protein n=1 Tax=Ideonella sp. BN130291 TaxID=3112940 RepID=UPI002E264D6E|nr:phosphatase PAP2 family protein [Ideonella sp. BN130291]
MPPVPADPSPAWLLITRLGEAQILLPALLAVLTWFVLRLGALRVAATWLLCVSVAVGLTTITKVAFLGWGIGYAPWNFTGISGHAMFAAAVLPVLGATLAATAAPASRPLAAVIALALAALIAYSRVQVGAHSPSEALAGWMLGAVASTLAVLLARAPHSHAPKALMLGLVLWLLLTPASAPRSRTHDWVTRLSLALSGHSQPYTRQMMLERYRLEHPPRAAVTGS